MKDNNIMNEEEKKKLILSISNFYMIFQKEILDLVPDNNLELSHVLFKALHEIYLDSEITPSILSKRLSITIPNTSRCLNKLTEMGYIVKIKDLDDKRITHIELSKKGLNLVENSRKLTDELLLMKLGVLNSDELLKLSDSFFVLRSLFEKVRVLNTDKY